MLPASLIKPLQAHLEKVKSLHVADIAKGYGAVYLPNALAKKYPYAPHDWAWQYVFPSGKLPVDPRSDEAVTRRLHVQD